MSDTRYGHTNAGGGSQDQGERKDEGWESRQGGRESNQPGRQGSPEPADAPGSDRDSLPPTGTNTQGNLAGIDEASDRTLAELPPKWREHGVPDEVDEMAAPGVRPDDASDASDAPAGTDQPPRMGGPLGPDPDDPHLPEGAQNADNRGSGARGFDVGVDASRVGAVHQGVKEEDSRDAR